MSLYGIASSELLNFLGQGCLYITLERSLTLLSPHALFVYFAHFVQLVDYSGRTVTIYMILGRVQVGHGSYLKILIHDTGCTLRYCPNLANDSESRYLRPRTIV